MFEVSLPTQLWNLDLRVWLWRLPKLSCSFLVFVEIWGIRSMLQVHWRVKNVWNPWNAMSCWLQWQKLLFWQPALWSLRHWGTGVAAHCFIPLSELERRFGKVKILGLGRLCHLHFPPASAESWDAGTQAQPVAWPSFAQGRWKWMWMTQCLSERTNPTPTVSAGSYAFKNLMALKEQLLSHLNFATPCILLSGWFRLL